MIKRGALIVVEGVDRSGKSTQCKKLVQSLEKRSIPVNLMNFPDRTTTTGKLISEYLRNTDCQLNDHAIHLLFSANRWENVDKMKKLLYDGVTLIVDRYSYSGIVFSAIKEKMDIDWCSHPENGLPKPDCVFLLTLTEEEMAKRPGFGNERYENVMVQRKVAEMFSTISKTGDNWKVVNAADKIEQVQKVLLAEALNKIEEVEMMPLQYLNFKNLDV